MSKFNEDSRVKLPAILHLTQLGYTYLSLKDAVWDEETNIFTEIFKAAIQRINPELSEKDTERLYQEISLDLETFMLSQNLPTKMVKMNLGRI